jgi:hypothetical protein
MRKPPTNPLERWLLDRDGHLTVTIPETVQASAADLAPALAAA